jgi:2-iminobutanoate/2-iminopropanoate deaminase
MRRTIVLLVTGLTLAVVAWVTWAQKPVPAGGPPYSPARQAAGQEVRGSIDAETRQVMENLGRILKENGCGFEDVVNATVYLSDINDYAAMNRVYASYFPNGFPARACVGGASLVFGFKVEISAIAYKPSK